MTLSLLASTCLKDQYSVDKASSSSIGWRCSLAHLGDRCTRLRVPSWLDLRKASLDGRAKTECPIGSLGLSTFFSNERLFSFFCIFQMQNEVCIATPWSSQWIESCFHVPFLLSQWKPCGFSSILLISFIIQVISSKPSPPTLSATLTEFVFLSLPNYIFSHPSAFSHYQLVYK